MAPRGRTLLAAAAGTGALLFGAGLWTQSRLGADLLPHAFCITASPPLLWLHLASDGLIALAYLLIPWALLSFVRRRADIPFGWLAWLFGAFIVACGMTHAMEVWTLWEPVYWYSGVLKAFTALVSLGTAWVLFRLMPQALALPSAAQLRAANAALEHEVAARRATESQLRTAKEELESLLGHTTARAQEASAVLARFFEFAPVGLVLVGEDQRIARVNPALLAITGRTGPDYLGRRYDDVPRLPEEAARAMREVWRAGEPRLNVRVNPRDAAGNERHLLSSYFPIPLPSGAMMMGAMVQDVSREHEIEQQRQDALARAEEANRSKDEFLAKVSHELRSPLQIALSSTEVLRRVPEMPQQARKFIDRLAHAVSMQARMINDLLDVSRILSGKLHVENEITDPAAPLLRILDHWRGVAGERGIRVDTKGLEDTGARVEADPARLEQVYANLLDNAIRFSGDGTRIEVGAYAGRSRWRFFVRDHGAGMAEGEAERLFQPFVQGSVQPRSGKGLGLGLAIVRSLVEAFGGRVWAESAGTGQGCTFVVELPLADADPSSGTGSGFGSGFGHGGESVRLPQVRVLYVEDEADVAAAMQAGLRRLGAEVSTAASHAEAVAQLAQGRFDVVVTDLNLGEGGTGHDVARALHAMPGQSNVPVIAVSAFGTPQDVDTTRSAGFRDHLVKPVDAVAVARAILNALRA